MYQAIVFLPLLGAILAGLIALVGAHARNPGGDDAASMAMHHDAHASACRRVARRRGRRSSR